MRTLICAVAGAMLLLPFGLSSPARADCAGDIANLEAQLAESSGNAKAKKVSNMIAKSKAALAEKKRKKCEKVMAKAKAAFEEGEAASGGGKGGAAAGGGGNASAEACAAKVTEMENRLTPMESQHPRRANIEAFLFNAKDFAAKGKTKKCQNLVKKADAMLTNTGY